MIGEKRENRGEQPEEQVNIQEILFRYLIHWPWFVVSVIICIACAWGYLRLATPVYDITATVLIKDDKKAVVRACPPNWKRWDWTASFPRRTT